MNCVIVRWMFKHFILYSPSFEFKSQQQQYFLFFFLNLSKNNRILLIRGWVGWGVELG